MSTHEEDITATAKKWYEVYVETEGAQKRVDQAKAALAASNEKLEALRRELSKCVGANIQRRCISMQDGHMILVQYRKDYDNTVCVEELLR